MKLVWRNCELREGNLFRKRTQMHISIPVKVNSGGIMKLKVLCEAGLKVDNIGDLYIKFDVNIHEFILITKIMFITEFPFMYIIEVNTLT
ncbi:MAG: hypothetical protein ACTS80_02100 [Candidatus Hodgkinia cicadicola]